MAFEFDHFEFNKAKLLTLLKSMHILVLELCSTTQVSKYYSTNLFQIVMIPGEYSLSRT